MKVQHAARTLLIAPIAFILKARLSIQGDILKKGLGKLVMRARGDPHFSLWLTPEIRTCFMWTGNDGDIYNILTDPSRRMHINAMFTNPGGEKRSTPSHKQFITQIAINLPRDNLAIRIYPNNVTTERTNSGVMSSQIVPLVGAKYLGKNIQAIFHRKSKQTVGVRIIIRGLKLIVTMKNFINKKHLDIAVLNPEILSDNIGGIFGAPYSMSRGKKEARIEEIGGKYTLYYNNQSTVTHKKAETKEPSECWLVKELSVLTNHPNEFFKVESMTTAE